MKTRSVLTLGLCLWVASLSMRPALAADLPPGLFNLKAALGENDTREFVEVRLGRNLIHMAAQMVEPTEGGIAEILRGLDQIHVNVAQVSEEGRESALRHFESVRKHLDDNAWERVVTVQQNDESVCVHLKSRDEQTVEGLVVTVLEGGGNAVLVRITGDIQPAQIGLVADALNIEPLKKLRRKLAKE